MRARIGPAARRAARPADFAWLWPAESVNTLPARSSPRRLRGERDHEPGPGFRLNKWVMLAVMVAIAIALYVASFLRVANPA